MRKIFAKRSNTSLAICCIKFVPATALIVLAVCCRETPAIWLLLIAGCAVFLWGMIPLVRFLKTPKVIIERDGDELFFPNFSCMVWEIESVSENVPWNHRTKVEYGTLTLVVSGKKYKFYSVGRASYVAGHLERLANSARKNRNQATDENDEVIV